MSKLIGALKALIVRLEKRAVGDVQSVLSPLTRMVDSLKTVEKQATTAANKVDVEISDLAQKAREHKATALAAATAAVNLAALTAPSKAS